MQVTPLLVGLVQRLCGRVARRRRLSQDEEDLAVLQALDSGSDEELPEDLARATREVRKVLLAFSVLHAVPAGNGRPQ